MAANRITKLEVEVLTDPVPQARETQEAAELLTTATPNARVTQEATELLTTATPNARVTQEAAEVLAVPITPAYVTQAGVEVVDVFSPNARITQAGIEVITVIPIGARVTQAGLEVVDGTPGKARVTQAGIEVVSKTAPIIAVWPGKASAGTQKHDPVVQVYGNALLHFPPVKAGAISVPGPHWSVAVYGALANAGTNSFNLDPSYDIRPGAKNVGGRIHNPWLGPPFNANDNWSGATRIPQVGPVRSTDPNLPYTVRGSTGGFTLEPNEPQPVQGAISATGWYTFTPTVTSFYQFDLTGSLYLTSVAVYQQGGSGVGGLVPLDSNQAPYASNTYAYLTAGVQYWIQVGTQGANPGGIFQLTLIEQSPTCQPSQCYGSMTANFWSGYCGSLSPSVVGGFGGFPEVARDVCPQGWSSINVEMTLDTSNNWNDQWYLCWEIHDSNDQLLGGRGSFFGTGANHGLSSWQDKSVTSPGGTITTTYPYTPTAGGDTSQAAYFVFYAFPVWQNILSGNMHARATYNGTCTFLPTPVGGPKSWAWWT